ncbi:MAG: hypothetical protein Kilf2KO_28210 [Rhodospirillales bacterium]
MGVNGMSEPRPQFLERGERARLFPVLAETSKEGRATSILLACLASVKEFSDLLLSSLGRRIGTRARVECYTEVQFKAGGEDAGRRPDGLIVVWIGNRSWSALVESKIGNATLDVDQVESYLRIARQNGIDAVVTISNQFATQPTHHPVTLPAKSLGKVGLYHWSWMYLLTQADLLLTQEGVKDADQHFILNELKRFLAHSSTGVTGFTAMPPAWSELVQTAAAGGQIHAKSNQVEDVVVAWHQEIRDLALILSRQLAVSATVKLPRAQANSLEQRRRSDAKNLAETSSLSAQISIPGAAALLEVQADLRSRSISLTMRLRAPEDRKSTKARVNWLLRQLPDVEDDYYVRLHWPGRGGFTQHALTTLKESPETAQMDRPDSAPHSLEVCMVKQTAGRFSQRKNFIADLESYIPTFYKTIGENLKAWQPPAPKVRKGRSEAEDVTPEALGEAAEWPESDTDAAAGDEKADSRPSE